ncbi:imidazolonepropionase [Marimonas arenosa]|uniref:Imidazolonepropionase n=1 Tax=Marimonas arenosa TaxID=1795305 RepID=A0AAE3WEB9_9RHOB|nr:imidazolonepropionase [Marimonas arenosa]MDQ2091134.1 imidazolonepropionase [Marimonas arenosa]
MSARVLITEVRAATMAVGAATYGLIPDAAIALDGDRILWVGPRADCPGELATLPRHSFDGRLVTPALIDCHTHIVHAGHRAREFEMRLEGASYEEIARAGGGIISTVSATRAAGEVSLVSAALPRVDALIAEGVSTIEIKSGYGLDIDTEMTMLRAARALGRARPVTIVTSFLGAHAVPSGMDGDSYVDDICLPALDAAQAEGLVDAVDGFCEGIAFNPSQIARVFGHARALGLPVKLHAEQLSHTGGTQLAARYGALSADHIEYAAEADAAALARSGTTAVLLPGAFYTLHETQKPPVDSLRRHGVPMALATDWNPGSSPMGSLLLAMNMGCTLFGLTPAEALAATTRNAARALGLTDRGSIAPGQRADLAIWDVEDPAELSYRFGVNPLHARIYGGVL